MTITLAIPTHHARISARALPDGGLAVFPPLASAPPAAATSPRSEARGAEVEIVTPRVSL